MKTRRHIEVREDVMRRMDTMDTEGEQQMNNSWRGAPTWAIDLLELQYYVMLQNEEILAKLNDRSTRLSPQDQRALDEFTNILKGTNAKIDDAKQDKPS